MNTLLDFSYRFSTLLKNVKNDGKFIPVKKYLPLTKMVSFIKKYV